MHKCLDRGIRVGALGVVIKLHAALLRHILDAVLDCLKTLQHFDNLIHRNTELNAMPVAAITFS